VDCTNFTDKQGVSAQSRKVATSEKTLCAFAPLRLCVKYPRAAQGKTRVAMNEPVKLKRNAACARFAFRKPIPIPERAPPPAVQLSRAHNLGIIAHGAFLSTPKRK
jgi:hypothetical protein